MVDLHHLGSGDMSFMCEAMKENIHKLEKLHWKLIHSKQLLLQTCDLIEKYHSLCGESISLLNFLRYAVFGGYSRSRYANVQENSCSKTCSICNKENCKLRCSRCKHIYYCSREHQSKDWSTHKVLYCNIYLSHINSFSLSACVRSSRR